MRVRGHVKSMNRNNVGNMSGMITLRELAERIGAQLDGGDGSESVRGIAPLESAQPGDVTFLTTKKYATMARATSASAVICSQELTGLPKSGTAALRCKNPDLARAKAIEIFFPARKYAAGIHATAVVDASAKIGKNAHVGPYVIVGANVSIGDDCVLLAHVVIYDGVTIGNRFFAHAHAVVRENCVIGDDVELQNGVVLGADGFGFAKDNESGRWHKIRQTGQVVIGNNVEIHANSCVDRASMQQTRIDDGARIDNLVHIGHGSTVGENSLLCAQVGLAGSTEIGKNVVLAGQVGVAGHCRVGDGVQVVAQSGIPGDVEDGRIVSGSPIMDFKVWKRAVAVFPRLPEIARALRLSGKEEEKP